MAKQAEKKSFWQRFKRAQVVDAEKSLIQDMLEDMYMYRGSIY